MATETQQKSANKVKRERKALTPEQQAQRDRMKEAKFRELGEARVTNALKRIAQVGNLSNRNSYKFTPEQAAKVVKALQEAVETVANQFKGNDKAPSMFTL